jgi:hypothetical protein
MAFKLLRFRVTNFRSVDDSGWVEVGDVTALVGTNESGKTNLLLPLWKLNPAKEGAISPTADYPRKHYSEFRSQEPKPVFVQTIFDVGADFANQLSEKTGFAAQELREVSISRRFEGDAIVDFPKAEPLRSIGKGRIVDLLTEAENDLTTMNALKSEEDLKTQIITAIGATRSLLSEPEQIGGEQLQSLISILRKVKIDNAPKTSTISPRFQRLQDDMSAFESEISRSHPRAVKSAVSLVLQHLPKFVYYSNYGNLDSEIYLPHVIENMERKDLGGREQAKARTLKVLFEFVNLQPKEILELGRDLKEGSRQPTEAEIDSTNEKKKQRSILLQSASTLLTGSFAPGGGRANTGFVSRPTATISEFGSRTRNAPKRLSSRAVAPVYSGF